MPSLLFASPPFTEQNAASMTPLAPCTFLDDYFPGSGMGSCEGRVPASLFPGPGAFSTYSVMLQVFSG
jgi:hypothetical protein